MADIDWEKGVMTPPTTGAANQEPDWESGKIIKPASAARKLGDLGLSVAKGVVAVPEAAVGLADLVSGGRAGKFLENEGGAVGFRPKQAKEFLTSLQSDDLNSKRQQFQQADGIVDKFGVAVTNPSLIANAVAESVPLMGAGAVPARALLAAAPRVGAIGAGALGEGLVGAGSSAEQIRQETEDGLLTGKQALLAGGSGAATAAFGAAGGAAARRLGIADVDTALTQGTLNAGTAAANKGLVRRAAEGVLSEGVLEELPQSLSEQALQNIALDKPVTEGLTDAGVMGVLAGGVMGGGAAALTRQQQAQGLPDPDAGQPPAQPPAPAGEQPPAPFVNPPSLTGNNAAAMLGGQGNGLTGSADPLRAVVTPSQAMGIDPNAGVLSRTAAEAVDGPASMEMAVRQAERDLAALAAEDNPEAGADPLTAAPDPLISQVAGYVGEMGTASPQMVAAKFGVTIPRATELLALADPTVDDLFPPPQGAANVSNTDAAGALAAGAGGPVGVDAAGSGPDAGLLAPAAGASAAGDTAAPGPAVQEGNAAPVPGRDSDAALKKGPTQTKAKVGGLKGLIARNKAAKSNVQDQPQVATTEPAIGEKADKKRTSDETPPPVGGDGAAQPGAAPAGNTGVEAAGVASKLPSGVVSKHSFGRKAIGLQNADDRRSADAKLFSDLVAGKTFSQKRLDGLDAKTQAAVQRHMLRIAQDPKVLDAVVKLIPVDVVNMLGGFKLTPQMVLNDPSVLKRNGVRGDGNDPVSIPIDGAASVMRAVARVTAENLAFDKFPHSGGLPVNGSAANDAGIPGAIDVVRGATNHSSGPVSGGAGLVAEDVGRSNDVRFGPGNAGAALAAGNGDWQGVDSFKGRNGIVSQAVETTPQGREETALLSDSVSTEPNLEAAKALLTRQKAATGNAVAEGKLRKELRDLAAKTPETDTKTVLALDTAATRLGMGEGKLKGLEFKKADAPAAPTVAARAPATEASGPGATLQSAMKAEGWTAEVDSPGNTIWVKRVGGEEYTARMTGASSMEVTVLVNGVGTQIGSTATTDPKAAAKAASKAMADDVADSAAPAPTQQAQAPADAPAQPEAPAKPSAWSEAENGFTKRPVHRYSPDPRIHWATVQNPSNGVYVAEYRIGDKVVSTEELGDSLTAVKFHVVAKVKELDAKQASHQDPGEKPEAATKGVVNDSLKTAAKNEDTKPSEMRKWLLAEIDKELLQAPDRADYDEAVKRMGEKDAISMYTGNGFLGKNAETGFITFDVPGDGKFKVRNSVRGLLEFRKTVNSSLGFKDGGQKTLKPEQNDGVRGGSGGQMAAVTNMIEEGDFEAARDFAEAVGIKLEDVKVPRGDMKPAWDKFLKDGTLPPAAWMPSKEWQFPDQGDNSFAPESQKKVATLTRVADGSTYVATVKGYLDGTSASYTLTKDGKEVGRPSTRNSFSEVMRMAEDAMPEANDKPAPSKASDTGWNMAGTGYGGKRYTGRNITLADGRQVVARIYENAGTYEEAEVREGSKVLLRLTDRYRAQERVDAWLDRLMGKTPALDLMGFKMEPMDDDGSFRLLDGNMVVSVERTDTGLQARHRSAKSSPRLTDQQAVEWAANIRDESKKEQAAPAAQPVIPDGYKPAGEPFYRDGKLTQGYAPFDLGQRVTMKESGGQSGVIDLFTSPDKNGVFDGAMVKFDNGVEQIVKLSKLEAAVAPAAATGTRRDPTKVSMFNPYSDGDIVTIDGQDWTVKADTPGWYLTTTGNWRGQHPTIRNVKAMADLIREVEQAAEARPAPQPEALNPLEFTPKQYHEAKLRQMAERNGVPLAEVREMYDTDAGRAENEQEWVDAVVRAAGQGTALSRATVDKLLEVRPDTRLPESALPQGYQRPEARKAEKEQKAKPAAPAKPIADFGEKIGGAKKDMWTGFKDDLTAVSDDDIASQPLSKVWPAPDYQALIDGGASPEVIAFVRSARDEVPAKPRVAYKVKAWANKVRTLRGMAVDLMAGKITMDDVRNQLERTGALSRSMQGFMGRVDLYQAVGHEKSLDGIRMAWHNYTIYRGQKDVSMWVVEKDAAATAFGNWPTELATGKTKEEAIEAFKKAYAKLDSDKEAKKGVQFDIISFRGQDGYWIAKKLGRNHVKVHGPLATVKEAREYRDQNQADLVAKLEKIKEIPDERRDVNEPRVGEDMRNGADVTPELFAQTFSFKGVEFGNWVEQGRRQQDLNNAFDALMDMAAVLNIPPRAISLNGQLGLAFGARGSGGSGMVAAAHYEPDKVVINLTKKNGAGSLGHEWWHAVDNYFAKMRKENGGSFMTTARDVLLASRDSGYMPYAGVRPEMVKAFGDVVKAINLTGMKKRASVLDGKRSKEYWTTGEEMSARSFESYLIAKLQDQNASNDYLANIVSEGAWNAAAALGLENENSYPYPVAKEVPGIRAAFDQFFQTVQTKEDGAGNVAMFSRAQASAAGIPVQTAQQIVDAIKARWKNAPEVILLADMNDPRVPEAVRKGDAEQRSGGATGEPEGFYYRGTAYVVAGSLKTPGDVVRVLLHESLGHHGLRGVFGDGLKTILKQIATMRKSEVQAKAAEYGLDMTIEADRLQAAEEVLAVMAQSNPQAGFVKRAIGAIRAWLRENIPGLENMRLTDNDIVTQMILPARRFVQQGPDARVGDGVLAMSRSDNAGMLQTTSTSPAVTKLNKVMRGAGWEIEYIDLDMTGEKPKVAIRANRDDGRFLIAKVDSVGRASFETFQRERSLRMDGSTKGRRPLTPMVDDTFLGRQKFEGARSMLRGMVNYLVDNASNPVALSDMKSAWAGAMAAPVQQDMKAVEFAPDAGDGNGVPAVSWDEDARFSRSPRELAGMAADQLKMTLTAPGKLSWWSKTVGTMYGLAERHPAFKPVFNAAQSFIDDVSYYATDAADMAPKMLPKLENWRDIAKSPISAEDNKAIEAPVNEGTLLWARDESGRPVKVAELEAQAATMTADQKARRLLRNDKISDGVLKMWQGLPAEQYEKLIDSRYESQMLAPGVVWTDAELKAIWKLNDAQIGLYREVRAAIDKSLDNLAKSDLVRFVGKDGAGIKDAIMEAESVDAAALLARDYFIGLSEAEPDRAEMLLATANGVMDRADKVTRLKAQGYAPLSRFGKYTVDVVTEEGRQYFGLFESMREANQMAARMKGEFGKDAVSQGTLSDESFKLFQGITPETLELFGNMLGLSDTGDTPQDQAFQAYLKLTKNNRSAMKRLIQRKGILGYSQDVGRVLANFVYSNARQTASALHIGDLTDAINAIPQGQGEVKDMAVKLGEYIKNPQEEAQAFRGLLFAQYLGGNISSAIINALQPFQVSFPYLSQFGGVKQAGAEMLRATREYATGKKNYEPDLAKALKNAEDDGTVSPQEVFQLMAQAKGAGTLRSGDGTLRGELLAKGGNAWSKTAMAWGKVFGVAEQFNRRTTFIAAYRIAKAQKMADPAAFAKKAVQETQFIYSKANRPQWARGAIGATIFTFKTYSISYLELLHRMATQGGPEGKRAALLAVAVLLMMGGAGGLPFMEDGEDIADTIAQVMGYNFSSKQAKQELLEELFGEAAAQFIERGISGVAGVPIDVSGRFGMGNLVPGTGAFLQRNSNARDVLEVLGPAGDLARRGQESVAAFLKGDLKQSAYALSPRAIYNMAKGGDMLNTGMYRDDKGFKVIEATTGEGVLKAIGFQPNSVAKVQEANYLMQRQKDYYNATAQNIRAKWARGLFEKDEAMVAEAREAINAWNEKNPDQRMSPNMPAIWKRVREMAKDKDQRIADTAPKAMRQQFREETARVRESL